MKTIAELSPKKQLIISCICTAVIALFFFLIKITEKRIDNAIANEKPITNYQILDIKEERTYGHRHSHIHYYAVVKWKGRTFDHVTISDKVYHSNDFRNVQFYYYEPDDNLVYSTQETDSDFIMWFVLLGAFGCNVGAYIRYQKEKKNVPNSL